MRSPTVFLLSAALVACSSGGGTQPGDPCPATGACGDGQICDRTAPGGPVCLDAAGDLDNDGIPNGSDFCEHMAGGDHDEDGDGIGDECDACPIAAPPAQAESDGDGVDSPCDPDPRTPGDKIVLFNGFNAPLPASWAASAGWKIQGGEAIATPGDPNAMERLSAPLAVPSNRLAILASYRVDAIATGAASADAGVIGINDLPMGMTTVQCGGSRSGTTDQLLLTSDTTRVGKPLTNLFNPASLYRIAEDLDGASASCALISDTETGVVPGTSGGFALGRAGLYVRGATVRFAYLLVVSHP